MLSTNLVVILLIIMLTQSSRSLAFFASNLGKTRQFQMATTTTRSFGLQTVSFDDVISSPKSKTAKLVQNLLTKRKKRVEAQQTVVEGPRMVFDMLENPTTNSLVRQLLVSVDDYQEQYQDRLESLSLASEDEVSLQLVTPELLNTLSDTVTPQGIMAIVDIPEMDVVVADDKDVTPIYLVLDGVSDPGNVGTLLRSSLAVGCAGVLLLPGSCDPWSPKAVRSSMGASFQLPIVQAPNWESGFKVLQEEWGVEAVYAATMIEGDNDDDESSSSSSQAHFSIDWQGKASALVIGSEGNGLSEAVRASIHDKDTKMVKAVHVPMCAGIESLNAAVCGSVILFEYSRQCSSTV
mmetsp:Transcript_26352/g.64217  ORF Transcript_26352/g.64217 Transcript_26352/m.64217 type:complete len:350 (-) Transcript_26352:777-1826(-)